ncbi:MAG: 1-acyl-sn-glycerol-3-phosphate acyltransferase [Myxococcales bacterium]|nr:1-acyl-sn-glycerol-3-phosphate acyltransferase [Myxococcales bacterium]
MIADAHLALGGGARAVRRALSLTTLSLAALGRHRQRLRRGEISASFQQRAAQMSQLAREICDAHGLLVEVDQPQLLAGLGGTVIVSNHLSYLDPLALVASVPGAIIAKQEVASWPLIGDVGRALGVLFVRRDDPISGARALRQAARALEEGANVINFPEGTTSDGSTVLPFRRGLFGIALRCDRPLLPLRLDLDPPEAAWVGNSYFLPHYLRLATRPVVRCLVRVGRPIAPRGFSGARSLARAARAQLLDLAHRGRAEAILRA